MAESADDDQGGATSGRVPLVESYSDLVEIGRGGFAIVYRAWQEKLQRTVALKVLTRIDTDERSARRFAREAGAMGTLSWHPHIVAVYDSGFTTDGLPFLAMEYLEQGSLGDRIRRDGALSWPDTLVVGVHLAGALDTAHAAGVLHRDLKPENVLIDAFGEAKLADFGIAGVAGAGSTTTGHSSFTVAHAAPEVLLGQPATARSDLYSLGSTLYHLVTGAPAYASHTDESIVATALRVTTAGPPEFPDDLLPEDLRAVVLAAMQKDPEDRPATAADFGQMLQQVQAAHDQPTTPLRLRSLAEPPPSSEGRPDPSETILVAPPDDDGESTISLRPSSLVVPPPGKAAAATSPPAAHDVAVPSDPPPGEAAALRSTTRAPRLRWTVVVLAAIIVLTGIGWFAWSTGNDESGLASPASNASETSTSAPVPEPAASDSSTETTSLEPSIARIGDYFSLDGQSPRFATTCDGLIGICINDPLGPVLEELGEPIRVDEFVENLKIYRYDMANGAFGLSISSDPSDSEVWEVVVTFNDLPAFRFGLAGGRTFSGATRVSDARAQFEGANAFTEQVESLSVFSLTEVIATAEGCCDMTIRIASQIEDSIGGESPGSEAWADQPITSVSITRDALNES